MTDIHTEVPPMDDKGNFKRKFEVKMRSMGPDPVKDGLEKAVFVDGKKLDFKIDILRFLEAKRRGIDQLLQEQTKIEREFIKAVSAAINRKVTIEDIKKAIIEGWI